MRPTEDQISQMMDPDVHQTLQRLLDLIFEFQRSCAAFRDLDEDFSFGISSMAIKSIENAIGSLDQLIIRESEHRKLLGSSTSPLQFDDKRISWLMSVLEECLRLKDFHEASRFATFWSIAEEDKLMEVARSFTYIVRTPTISVGDFKQTASTLISKILKCKPGASGLVVRGKLTEAMQSLVALMQKHKSELDQPMRFQFFDTYLDTCAYYENTGELRLKSNVKILKLIIGSGRQQDRNKQADYLYIFKKLLDKSVCGEALSIFGDFVLDVGFLTAACENTIIIDNLILHCRNQKALSSTESNKSGVIAIISRMLSSLLIRYDACCGLDGEGAECIPVQRFFYEVDECCSLYEGDVLRIFTASMSNILDLKDFHAVQSCLRMWIQSCRTARCFYWMSKDERLLSEVDKACDGSKALVQALSTIFPDAQTVYPLIVAEKRLHFMFNPIILDNTHVLQRLVTSDIGTSESAISSGRAAISVLAKLLIWIASDLLPEDYKKYVSDQHFQDEISKKINEFSTVFHQFQKFYKSDPYSDFGQAFCNPLTRLVLNDATSNGIAPVEGRLRHVIESFHFLNDTFLKIIGWDKNLARVIKLMSLLHEHDIEKYVGLALTSHKAHYLYRKYTDRIKADSDAVIALLKDEIAKTTTTAATVIKKIDVYHTFLSALDNLSADALAGIDVSDDAAKGRVQSLSRETNSEYLDGDVASSLGLIFLQMIRRRITHSKSNIYSLCKFGYGLSDAIERKVSVIKFDPLHIVDGFCKLNHLNLPSETLPDAQQLATEVADQAQTLFTLNQNELEQKMVDCIQLNQSLAFTLIVKSSKSNVFLKVGTGQGKSFIIGMAVARIASKVLAKNHQNHRVYVLTSYSHLATRDHSSLAPLYSQVGAKSMVLVSVEDLERFTPTVLIVHADTKDFTRIVRTALLRVYAGRANDGEVQFLKSVYEDKNTVFLDEYDLLVEDLDEGDANGIMDVSAHGFLPGDIDAMKGRFGKLKHMIKTPGACAERDVVDEYDCRRGRMVSIYDPISKVLRLDPGIFSLSRFLSSSRRIVGLSGSTSGERTDFSNGKANVFYHVPLFQDPRTSSSAGSIQRLMEVQGVAEEESWVATLCDDVEMARRSGSAAVTSVLKESPAADRGGGVGGICILRPILVFVERSPADQADWIRVRDALRARFGTVDELYDEAEVTDLRLQAIAAPGAITMTTLICGRGADIRCSRDVPGGLHVLITFVPMHDRLLDQMKGRTSRMGRAGSYSLITKARGFKQQQKDNARAEDFRKGHDETKALLVGRAFWPTRAEGLELMCRLTEARFDAALILVLISTSRSMKKFIDGVKARMVEMIKALDIEAPGAFRFHFQYFRGMKYLIDAGGIHDADKHVTGETFDSAALTCFLGERGHLISVSGWGCEGVPFAVEAIVHARARPVAHTLLRRAVLITDDSSESFKVGGGPDLEEMLEDWASRAGVPVDCFVIENGEQKYKDATKRQMKYISTKTGGTCHTLDAMNAGDGQVFVSALRGCFVGGVQRGGD